MSLTDCIPPYEFSDDLGPDDLSDVDLSLSPYPNGVPIRRVPTLGVRTTDFHEWASEMLARFEAALPYGVDEAEALRSTLIEHLGVHETEGVHAWNPARQAVTALVEHGLTLRQIARYVPMPLTDVIALFTSGSKSYDPSQATAIADAHDMVVDGGLSQTEIGRRCDISRKTVMRLAKLSPCHADTGSQEVAA